MNFKEVYSKANDEIHGSEELLDKILCSAPRKNVLRIPPFVPVIAVAAMIAVIIAVPGIVNHDMPETIGNIRVADIRQVQDIPAPRKIAEPDGNKQSLAENTQEPLLTSETADSPVYCENPAEEPVATAEELADVISVNYLPELAGAEPSVMSRGIPEKPTVEMTAAEYTEYIGKDIAAVAVIPDDMTMESPEVIIAETDGETGTVVSEKATYFAHSGDYERFAEINVTRTQDILIPEEGLEISVICGNPVIITSDNTDYNASFSQNKVRYFIRSGGVTENELKNLLISLNGGSTNEQEDFNRNNGGIGGGIVTGNDDGISG